MRMHGTGLLCCVFCPLLFEMVRVSVPTCTALLCQFDPSAWDPSYFLQFSPQQSGREAFEGDIFLLSWYNRSLTEPEILRNYNASFANRCTLSVLQSHDSTHTVGDIWTTRAADRWHLPHLCGRTKMSYRLLRSLRSTLTVTRRLFKSPGCQREYQLQRERSARCNRS